MKKISYNFILYNKYLIVLFYKHHRSVQNIKTRTTLVIELLKAKGILKIINLFTGCKLGFAILLIVGIIISYSGTLLGKCWTIIDERFYQYRVLPCQNPYKRIAETAYGKEMG